jgi:hypothetical protein
MGSRPMRPAVRLRGLWSAAGLRSSSHPGMAGGAAHLLAGRYSEWEYYTSDHAFLTGKHAADKGKQLNTLNMTAPLGPWQDHMLHEAEPRP